MAVYLYDLLQDMPERTHFRTRLHIRFKSVGLWHMSHWVMTNEARRWHERVAERLRQAPSIH